MTPDPIPSADSVAYAEQVLAAKKLKKRILIVLASVLGTLLVLLLLVLLLQGIRNSMNEPEVPENMYFRLFCVKKP